VGCQPRLVKRFVSISSFGVPAQSPEGAHFAVECSAARRVPKERLVECIERFGIVLSLLSGTIGILGGLQVEATESFASGGEPLRRLVIHQPVLPINRLSKAK